MFCGIQTYTFTRLSEGVILISPPLFPALFPPLFPAHLVQFGRNGGQNPILARFRPPHTPSAEHAPTPAHPRTPAHLLDINNPDCHLLGKNCKSCRKFCKIMLSNFKNFSQISSNFFPFSQLYFQNFNVFPKR